jgi:bacteriocin biosynthesis cyclodehydratase domain-containing protein
MHPVLQPGIHPLRRSDRRIQVGLDRSRAVLLPDTPETRAGLRTLTSGGIPQPALVDAVRPLLDEGRSRPSGRVAVEQFGHPSGDRLAGRLREVVTRTGFRLGASAVDVAVVAGVGEPPRALVDRWSRRGIPHVVVRLVEGYGVVGPFVAPGRTACLRCTDAHATDQDPSWPLLVEQYAALSSRDRADGVPEPVDPALCDLVAAWAARDVATYLERRRPSTWSTSIRFDPRLHDLCTVDWPRHPDCGCGWEAETMAQ